MNKNLLKIINNGNLRDYILGIEEFQTTRPELDYSRWFELKKYYRDISSDNPQKAYIEGALLNLIESNDPEEKRLGILVGRVIGLTAIREMITMLIQDVNFDKLPLRTKDELCFSATLLLIREVEINLVRYFFTQSRLREFIFCSNTPPYINEVKEDDLWRVEAIEKFYNSSSKKNQDIIISDIEGSLKDSRNFRLAIHAYLENTSESTIFIKDVAHALNAAS